MCMACAVSALQSVPSVAAIPLAIGVAALSDRAAPGREASRTVRRIGLVWCAGVLASLLFLVDGVLLVRASALDRSSRHRLSIAALAINALALPIASTAAGPFWALHHETTPREIRGASIAVVNSIGNIGGFAGPFLLGALKSRLGPPCPPEDAEGEEGDGLVAAARASAHDHHGTGCVTQWGGALAAISGAVLLLNLLTAAMALAFLYPSRRLRAQRGAPAAETRGLTNGDEQRAGGSDQRA